MLGYLPFTAFMSKCKDNIFNHHVPPPLSLSVHIQYHKLLHGSHATAAIMTPSVAVVQMVTGVTGMHKCHVLHFPSTATVISAHWHMNDVNHNNMQYATCCLYPMVILSQLSPIVQWVSWAHWTMRSGVMTAEKYAAPFDSTVYLRK